MDLIRPDALTEPTREQVEALAEACRRSDGEDPFNEEARLARRQGTGVHWLGSDGEALVAAAWVDPTGDSGQFAVHPDHRRRGLGGAVLTTLLRDHPGIGLWSFGALPAAAALAGRRGLRVVRELLKMSRDLDTAPPDPLPPIPAGIGIRRFEPGRDELAWVELNARTFAAHPEQGRITVDDLSARMGEPWFRPEDFLLAEGPDGLLGYHWTKSIPGEAGEVYVLGVDPDHHGGGLGRLLLATGIAHLAERGHTSVDLYVEGSEQRVVDLYLSASFVVVQRDLLYSLPLRHQSDQTAGAFDGAADQSPGADE